MRRSHVVLPRFRASDLAYYPALPMLLDNPQRSDAIKHMRANPVGEL